MHYATRIAIVGALILAAMWVVYRGKAVQQSCGFSSDRPIIETFATEAPPVPGARSQGTSGRTPRTMPPVTETSIGVSDSDEPAKARDSTTLFLQEDSPSSVEGVESELSSDSAAPAAKQYDSMFDTRLAPAWINKPTSGELRDGKLIAQLTTGKQGAVPSSLPVGETEYPVPNDKRGEHPFSNLIECNQRNYLTAQNFWEWKYRYPFVPPEGSAPLAANYTDSPHFLNPYKVPRIIEANKDGGQPLPENTYFRPL